MLTVGSLFSGIGGLDLGLEQAGMKTIWQVEYDEWARDALNQNFPDTEKFKDVREVGKHNLKPVDLICGGFPCQDVSQLKTDGEGLDGNKSGLWSEYLRILREVRPAYALIENVPNLIIRGLQRVLADLASIGYDAEWQTLRASTVGLPQRRKRFFIIAYPASHGPVSAAVFAQKHIQSLHSHARTFLDGTPVFFEDLQYSYPQIPEHLRMDNGLSFELSEIEAAIKGYGNAVCPPVAKWIGERIIEFDREVNKCKQDYSQTTTSAPESIVEALHP